MSSQTVEFLVTPDPAGGYCASADLGDCSIFTEGDSLDELYAMIEDSLRLHQLESGETDFDFKLAFRRTPLAARGASHAMSARTNSCSV